MQSVFGEWSCHPTNSWWTCVLSATGCWLMSTQDWHVVKLTPLRTVSTALGDDFSTPTRRAPASALTTRPLRLRPRRAVETRRLRCRRSTAAICLQSNLSSITGIFIIIIIVVSSSIPQQQQQQQHRHHRYLFFSFFQKHGQWWLAVNLLSVATN